MPGAIVYIDSPWSPFGLFVKLICTVTPVCYLECFHPALCIKVLGEVGQRFL